MLLLLFFLLSNLMLDLPTLLLDSLFLCCDLIYLPFHLAAIIGQEFNFFHHFPAFLQLKELHLDIFHDVLVGVLLVTNFLVKDRLPFIDLHQEELLSHFLHLVLQGEVLLSVDFLTLPGILEHLFEFFF